MLETDIADSCWNVLRLSVQKDSEQCRHSRRSVEQRDAVSTRRQSGSLRRFGLRPAKTRRNISNRLKEKTKNNTKEACKNSFVRR